MKSEETWAWFGGVDFEEEDENAEKMGHITGEPEDVHGFCPSETHRENVQKRKEGT